MVPVPSLMSSIFRPLGVVMNFDASAAAGPGTSGSDNELIAAICSICRRAALADAGIGT
jgi:hypothetical protein